MSSLKNKVQLIGHVGQDPEILNLDSGKKVATFSIATNDFRKNEKGEWIEDTQWHNIVVWGNKTETVKNYVTKGREVAIDGKLTHRTYEKEDGSKQYFTEVVCHELLLIGKP